VAPPVKVIEIFGEGKTDIGKETDSEEPKTGVVAILVHTLCGEPVNMRVKRKAVPFLSGKGWTQKVKFAKRQAFYDGAAGVVFVLDTEGNHKERIKELTTGRDASLSEFPMAVGAAHPCIEAWLLADAKAIRKGLGLGATPELPDEPENLSAPQHDRKENPKTILAKCCKSGRAELSSSEKNQIASAMKDVAVLRARCPLGFGPFAVEVEERIRPLFFGASTE
jgi:Domain of unknown function (DUF4276)